MTRRPPWANGKNWPLGFAFFRPTGAYEAGAEILNFCPRCTIIAGIWMSTTNFTTEESCAIEAGAEEKINIGVNVSLFNAFKSVLYFNSFAR